MNGVRMFLAKRILIVVGSCLLAGWVGCDTKKPPAAPVPSVPVAEVTIADVPIHRDWVGSLEGAQNSQIEAKVSGYLLSQEYAEGSFVKAGTVLFRIDPRPYQAAVAQAQATLAQAQAKAELAKVTFARQEELFKTTVISAQQYDSSRLDRDAAVAAAQAAEASLEDAQLNLSYCTIIAPFDGIAGKAQAQVGDLVGQGSATVLTTVSQVQPIKVNFFLSEQEYLRAGETLAREISTPIEQRKRILEIFLANGVLYPEKGIFDFLNRQVDPRTGTIQVVALFSNPEMVLRPGQFAKVRVHVATFKDAVVIPQRAVNELQGTYYQVMVVGPDGTVATRSVTPSERTGSDWVIKEGLSKGDRIVVEGWQKLRNGMKINPKPYQASAPKSSPSPTPSPQAAHPVPSPGYDAPANPVLQKMQTDALGAPSPQGAASPSPATR